MLSLTNKFVFIFFLLILLPLISLSQMTRTTLAINEVKAAFDAGDITREHLEMLAVSINTGTNLPSVATPNGQAAFLFLLTSALAPVIKLGYGRMVFMALPYTVVLTIVGFIFQ